MANHSMAENDNRWLKSEFFGDMRIIDKRSVEIYILKEK
jgi:hypothetical protein